MTELEALTYSRASTFTSVQKPIATPEMVKEIIQVYPYGFYGYIDSGLGAFQYYFDLGFETTEILE